MKDEKQEDGYAIDDPTKTSVSEQEDLAKEAIKKFKALNQK
jgi:hypothetical protein